MAPWNMCPAFWRASFLLFLYTLCFFLAASPLSVPFSVSSFLFLLLALCFSCSAFGFTAACVGKGYGKPSGVEQGTFVITFWCFAVYSCQVVLLPCQNYIINFLAASESFHDFLLSGVLVILRWLCRACPLICIKMFTNIFIFITMEIKRKQRRKYSNWLWKINKKPCWQHWRQVTDEIQYVFSLHS